MRVGKLGIAAVACALAATFALAGCASDDASDASSASSADTDAAAEELVLLEDGKLTIAASLDFPPFESLGGDTPVGFSVELMDLLAEQMGLEAEFLPSTKFDTIVPLISAGGKADIGMSSFTITEERKQEIDFTDPYMDSNQGIVVLKDSGITSVDDLSGLRIATQSGTTGYDWAVENITDATVTPYDEMTAVFAALQGDQADAIVADLPVVQYYVNNAYTDMEVVQEIPTGEQYAIVVSQDNPALTEALNEALAAVKENGSYDELYEKWFGAAAE